MKRKAPSSTSTSTQKPAQCNFCSVNFSSKTKMFHHLHSGECGPALAAGFQAKDAVQKVALYIGHDGSAPDFMDILRRCLATALTTMQVKIPWNEQNPLTYRWTSTTTTKDNFLLEHNVPRVEEMIALSLPTINHTTLVTVLNQVLPPTMHVWRIVGPLSKTSHLQADTDCSKRRMECIVPWNLLCPNGPISPHELSLKPSSFHQFLLGFCSRSINTGAGAAAATATAAAATTAPTTSSPTTSSPTTTSSTTTSIAAASSSPLSLLCALSVKSKDVFVREIFHFLCRPNVEQLDAMKRMKRTFQAFQGYRSLHNFTSHNSLLPQNNSIQQKVERLALKGVVMVKNIGACIVLSCAMEKYFPTGALRIMLGLGTAVYRGMIPSESIPILLRGFVEKVKKQKVQGGRKKGKKSGERGGSNTGGSSNSSNSNSTNSTNSSNSSSKKENNNKRYHLQSFRRPIPLNHGEMSQVAAVEDVGGCVVMNIRSLGLPIECILFTGCTHSYWERKQKFSLDTVDNTLQGKKSFDARTGYRRSIIDQVGAFWGSHPGSSGGAGGAGSASSSSRNNGLELFLTQFVPKVAVVRTQMLSLMASSSAIRNGSTTLHSAAPQQYREVLRRLRLLRNSNAWPETSNGRARLIQKEQQGGDQITTMDWNEKDQNKTNKKSKNKDKKVDANEPATTFTPAPTATPTIKNGSFTVGFMPGHQTVVPKGNILFPNLMREIFQLENIITPNRASSSCCAVNCNAKFMPHKDSGAGNGQQISLIVGLGQYKGGQLGVEGEVHDIQYAPLEFDGWKQRHWTLPFEGERFSLVWFSPLGCAMNETGNCISKQMALAAIAKQEEAVLKKTNTTVTLRNDVQMPLMGIGTFHVKGEHCTALIQHAMCLLNQATSASASSSTLPSTSFVVPPTPPLILIDTAELYNNHHAIQQALLNIDRSTYFLVTKLSTKNMSNPSLDVPKAFHQSTVELFGSAREENRAPGTAATATATTTTTNNDDDDDEATEAIEARPLTTAVLDCYLMHWVAPHGSSHENKTENNETRIQCWLAMEQLYWQGFVRSIGVSNFTVKHLNLLLNDSRTTVVPHVNQVEIHPLYQQNELKQFCRDKKIQLQAYSSLGQSHLIQHSKIIQLAEQCQMSTVQLLLHWGLKHHQLPIIPRTTSIEHLEENINTMLSMVKLVGNDVPVDQGLLNTALAGLDALGVAENQKFAWDSTDF